MTCSLRPAALGTEQRAYLTHRLSVADAGRGVPTLRRAGAGGAGDRLSVAEERGPLRGVEGRVLRRAPPPGAAAAIGAAPGKARLQGNGRTAAGGLSTQRSASGGQNGSSPCGPPKTGTRQATRAPVPTHERYFRSRTP